MVKVSGKTYPSGLSSISNAVDPDSYLLAVVFKPHIPKTRLRRLGGAVVVGVLPIS